MCDGDRANVEFRDRLQPLINRAHEQEGNFQDRWRQNSDEFTSAAIQGGPLPMHTLSFTVADSP